MNDLDERIIDSVTRLVVNYKSGLITYAEALNHIANIKYMLELLACEIYRTGPR